MWTAVLLIALATAVAVYVRHRVDQAIAECATPAPPERPATPPPQLPGFAAGDACGPGEAPKGAAGTPPAVAGAAGKKP
jgi:hypothetical protein